MRFTITACHGSGNDFPLIDARAISLVDADWARVARALADRGGAVGGDGLLLLTPGDADHAFGMRMFNSDGSEAETCLNGLRCVARAGFEALGIDAARVRLATSSAAVRRAADLAPGVATIEETAGPVERDPRSWLIAGRDRLVDALVPGLPSARAFTALAIPNPHLIAFVDSIDEAELVMLGRWVEAAPPLLPRRANVSFVTVREGNLFVRTFERGVGLTDSCGSAMAASTHAAALTGRVAYDAPLTVFNRGGLVRACPAADGCVTLCGNATFAWTGAVTVDLARATAGALEVIARHDDETDAWAALVTNNQMG